RTPRLYSLVLRGFLREPRDALSDRLRIDHRTPFDVREIAVVRDDSIARALRGIELDPPVLLVRGSVGEAEIDIEHVLSRLYRRRVIPSAEGRSPIHRINERWEFLPHGAPCAALDECIRLIVDPCVGARRDQSQQSKKYCLSSGHDCLLNPREGNDPLYASRMNGCSFSAVHHDLAAVESVIGILQSQLCCGHTSALF